MGSIAEMRVWYMCPDNYSVSASGGILKRIGRAGITDYYGQ
jgi:hypothetical protein